MNTSSRRVVISESVSHAVLGDEAVLLDVQSGVYFGLDSVGTRIWQLLAGECTEEEINRQLLEEYDVDPEQLRADVAGFLRSLAEKGLAHGLDE
jgi:Coenzyme PQQ synthesis protein D (PqqD)